MQALTLGLLILPFNTVSAGEQGRSIMFQDQGDELRHLTTVPQEGANADEKKCAEMVRKLKALKGKPQRRYALDQRYRLECLEHREQRSE